MKLAWMGRGLALAIIVAANAQFVVFAQDGDPQIAYKMLSAWVDKGQADAIRGKHIATGILGGTGGLLVGSAAVTWFAGDTIATNATGSAMDPDTKLNLSVGLGVGGMSLLGAAAIVAAIPVPDPRVTWADVFNENDPILREAMAVSALRSLAQQGKERRIASFVSSFLVPVLSGGIQVGINLSQSKGWSDGLMQTVGSSSWSIAAGLTSLLSTTPEEKLYSRYLVAKGALDGAP